MMVGPHTAHNVKARQNLPTYQACAMVGRSNLPLGSNVYRQATKARSPERTTIGSEVSVCETDS